MGAAAFMLLAIEIGGDASGRIASYIISGVGFLGAGVIMKDGMNVSGLNTAATIWCSAAVGALSGLGKLPQACIVSIAIMSTHLMLRPMGLWLNRISFGKSPKLPTAYLFTIHCRSEVENTIRILLMQFLNEEDKVLLRSLSSDEALEGKNSIIAAEINALSPQDSFMERIASRLTLEDKVYKVRWQIIGTESEL